MSLWWIALNKMNKTLQSEKKLAEMKIVSDVMKKGIEPAYNFYHIEAQSVAEKAVLMTALLVFYVIYTMWWGYSIFYMFDGLGLSMKKAKVKKEV
jgi:capsid portal protein